MTVRKRVAELSSIQTEVKSAIPGIRKEQGDAVYRDLENWKVEKFTAQILSEHEDVDRKALDSLIVWTYYYHFLR